MKIIKHALCIGLAFASAAAFAQQGPPPGGPPPAGAASPAKANESRLQAISKAADLTADQQIKVRAILQQSAEELSAMRRELPIWNDEAKAAIDKLWVKERARILAVLVSEQKPTYETYMDNWLAERAKDAH